MRPVRLICLLLCLPSLCLASGKYFSVEYPPSKQPGELVFGVTYTIWVPDGVSRIRGVIVHQHGCGEGACKGGETAAYDLHWQALAKKWDCALMGPSYHQPEKENCCLWCDPRNGSDKTFLKSLGDLAAKSGRAEIAEAPWCLWGHSGGGFWSSIMQTLHPERIVAIWFRSGTAFSTWNKNDVPKPEMPAAMFEIPMMCNPGAKENGDKRFSGAWTGSMEMFMDYRARGAPIGFTPDPLTAHQCGDSRYLAIPFFDACLALRLPESGVKLKTIDQSKAWLAPLLGDAAKPAASFEGNKSESCWLPNEAVAKAWSEYVKTGSTADTTPPPAPTDVKSARNAEGLTEITWSAEADFESGIQQFIIERDGKDIGRVPEMPAGKFGRALFQSMSYHDTPERPLPEMKWADRERMENIVAPKYAVKAVNSAGLISH